jgi:transcription-repair coupling factor (superfamily II helicase)
VENGLDIPNANTIIVNEAQNFGLSDLHQLRGRVGRSNKKAYCYLLAPSPHLLPDLSRKRLQAIEQFSDLGSGIHIAMKDLDIRGAGDLLGAEQSGFINDIGFETYHKILEEAVRELKDEHFKDLFDDARAAATLARGSRRDQSDDCIIETDLTMLIPNSYVSETAERLALYRKLDDIKDENELQKFTARDHRPLRCHPAAGHRTDGSHPPALAGPTHGPGEDGAQEGHAHRHLHRGSEASVLRERHVPLPSCAPCKRNRASSRCTRRRGP